MPLLHGSTHDDSYRDGLLASVSLQENMISLCCYVHVSALDSLPQAELKGQRSDCVL
jgi:hypothetical protein